jgi:hypothetical protein
VSQLQNSSAIGCDSLAGIQGDEVCLAVPDSQEGLNIEVVLPVCNIVRKSGIGMLMNDENEVQNSSGAQQQEEALKLLRIQQQIDFCYDETDTEVEKVMIKEELQDREKKAE